MPPRTTVATTYAAASMVATVKSVPVCERDSDSGSGNDSGNGAGNGTTVIASANVKSKPNG